MTEIIKIHLEQIPTLRQTHIRNHRLGLRPRMHAMAIIIPNMAMKLKLPLLRAPRSHAQRLILVAEPIPHSRDLRVRAGVLVAAGQTPAVFGAALVARVAQADAHGGLDGAADPAEGVELAVLVGVVFELHVRGELGVFVGVEVVGGAVAGGLAHGVEVLGPPDWVPDVEVFLEVAVVDGARVGGVPGLGEGGVAFGDVGEDGWGVFGDFLGDAVDDGHGAGDGCWDKVVGDDGEGGAGRRGWDHISLGEGLGGGQVCRHHGDHGGGRRRIDCGGLQN